jgi:hypothetical protein
VLAIPLHMSRRPFCIFERCLDSNPVSKSTSTVPLCRLHYGVIQITTRTAKFETAVLGYSEAWEKLIHEKNLKSKISWHCTLITHSTICNFNIEHLFNTIILICLKVPKCEIFDARIFMIFTPKRLSGLVTLGLKYKLVTLI